jgi:hypothetical protein
LTGLQKYRFFFPACASPENNFSKFMQKPVLLIFLFPAGRFVFNRSSCTAAPHKAGVPAVTVGT